LIPGSVVFRVFKILILQLFLLSAVLFAISFFMEKGGRNVPKLTHEVVSNDYYRDDPNLGWAAKKSVTTKVQKFISQNNELIFDAIYSFDEYGRRNTGSSGLDKDTFMIFLGSSDSFGVGLNDSETLPGLIASRSKSRVYNYSFLGYGANQHLALLQSQRILNEVPETKGLFLVEFNQYSRSRVIGDIDTMRWGEKGPYFFLNEDGDLIRRARFVDGRPLMTRLYQWIGRKALWKRSGLKWPNRYSEGNQELVCEVLAETQLLIKEQKPQSQLILFFTHYFKRSDPIVERCLKPLEIDYIDLKDIWNEEKQGAVQIRPDYENHYSREYNQVLADKLWEALQKRGLAN
jgi:hypothetical protein